MFDSLYLAYPLVDLSVSFEGTFPLRARESRVVSEVRAVAGGSANTILMAARLGGRIAPYGAVGGDLFGRLILDAYAREGVPDRYLSTVPELETPKVVIPLAQDGEHGFLSMVSGSYGDLGRLEEAVEASRAVIVTGYQLYTPEARQTAFREIALAKKHGRRIFLDPGPLFFYLPQMEAADLLTQADVLLCNGDEARALSGESDPGRAARKLGRMTRALLALKAGPEGCYIGQGGGVRHFPGFSVDCVDTTGAGDVFLAAFLLGYLRGWPMEETAELANAAGAAKAAKQGCGSDVPNAGEVAALLRTRNVFTRYGELSL